MKAGGIFGNSQLGSDVGPTTSAIPTETIMDVDPRNPPAQPQDVVLPPEPTGPMISEGTKKPVTATGVLVVLGLAIAGLYALWPKKMKTNPRRNPRKRRAKKRSERELWDLLWENFIAAKRSGSKSRILATAELLEGFDRARGWKPMVTVAKVKQDYGW
jgi:hypothetical protein